MIADALVEPVSAREIITFKTVLRKDAASNVAAQAALTHHVDGLARLKFAQPRAQFVHGNVHKAFRVALRVFLRRARVQQRNAAIARERGHILIVKLLYEPLFDVLRHKARHVDRILGRGKGRRVGEIKVLERDGAHPRLHGRGQHVDALIYAIEAHDLRAQQPERALFVKHLHGHHFAAGIVRSVAGGRKHDLFISEPRRAGRALVEPRGGGCHIEELDHRRALRAAVYAIQPTDVVRGHASLLVGWASQRNQRFLSGHQMADLHRVAHGVNVHLGSLHALVHGNAALRTQFQPRRARQLAVRRYADGQHHHIRLHARRVVQAGENAAVLFLKPCRAAAQQQFHAFGKEFRVHEGGHIRVQRAEELIHLFHQRHMEAARPEVLRHFQADKTPADHRGRLRRLRIDELADAQRVLHGAQGENPLQFHARQIGHHRPRAGRENQLIVAFLIGFAAIQRAHGNGLARWIDGRNFAVYAHVEGETRGQALRRLHRKRARFLNHIAHVIGQAAIGIRHIPGAFQHHDLRRFIQPAQPRRGGCAARDAADDHHFHSYVPPSTTLPFQPAMPPILTTEAYPMPDNCAAARALRPPLRQYT